MIVNAIYIYLFAAFIVINKSNILQNTFQQLINNIIINDNYYINHKKREEKKKFFFPLSFKTAVRYRTMIDRLITIPVGN